MPLAHVYCSDALSAAYATFYDISVPSPRIMKILLVALISDNYKATRESAIRGLVGIGKDGERTRGGWRSEKGGGKDSWRVAE